MPVLRIAAARATRRLAAASLATLALASDAPAQRHLAPAGVRTVATPPAAPTAEARAAMGADRADRVLDHTLNGMLVGAGVGLAVAIIMSSSGNHGEGAPAAIVLPVAGGVLGTVVGTVVGLVRTR